MLRAILGLLYNAKVINKVHTFIKAFHSSLKRYARELHFVDSDKIAVTGVSYGAYITTLMLAEKHQNFIACGVAVSPVVDWRFYGE